jgi:hypothetical protein
MPRESQLDLLTDSERPLWPAMGFVNANQNALHLRWETNVRIEGGRAMSERRLGQTLTAVFEGFDILLGPKSWPDVG